VSEGRGFAPFRIRAGLDDRTVEELESALVRYCATTTGDVVVDGSDLERIDGSGLRTLLGVAHQLRPLGRRVVLCGFPASCGRAIDRAGLGQQRWLDDGREGPDAAAGDGTAGPSRSR
jgi:anti-anti-sigma factor